MVFFAVLSVAAHGVPRLFEAIPLHQGELVAVTLDGEGELRVPLPVLQVALAAVHRRPGGHTAPPVEHLLHGPTALAGGTGQRPRHGGGAEKLVVFAVPALAALEVVNWD